MQATSNKIPTNPEEEQAGLEEALKPLLTLFSDFKSTDRYVTAFV